TSKTAKRHSSPRCAGRAWRTCCCSRATMPIPTSQARSQTWTCPAMSLRQPQPARATIRDVAAQAGVSVSSVSRVMNGEPHISPELHARIMRAVNRLRFEPHSAAQALRSRESKTIGCMVSDLSNPLYSEMINGAEEEFQRAGYVLMLAATRHEQDRETAFISAVRRRRMDGLLLFAGDNAHTDFT